MTPGTYLRKRREAAGLMIADVAAAVATEPRLAEHVRAEWIELIERDEQPATWATAVTLGGIFPVDFRVLIALVEADLGLAPVEPGLCAACAVRFSIFHPESAEQPGHCARCAIAAGQAA